MPQSISEPDLAIKAIAKLNRRPEHSLPEIPGDLGLPLIGHSLKLIANAPDFVLSRYAQHGPVFKMSAFGTPSVNFADVDAARMIIMNKDKNFSSELGWWRMSGLLQRGILLRDFSEHRGHRRVLQKAFKQPALAGYAERLNEQLSEGVNQWPTDSRFLFQPKVKSLLLNNAASLFLGAQLGPESDRLNQHFVAILNATVSVLRVNLPGTSWHRGLKGAAILRNWLASQVKQRLNSTNTDFFTELCKLSRDQENEMSIDEVIDHTVLLLFAAHDTTTSTICSVVSVLCDQPQWQNKLREELKSINAPSLTMNDFAKLPLTDQFFKEVLRRYPPIFVILRRCIKAFDYDGIHIPANTQTNINISLLHHNHDLWTNPMRFDPDRFSDARAEHKKELFQYLPFGGGAHKCLGVNFAEIQTKIFLFHLLRQYQVNVDPERKMAFHYLPMPLPKDGLPITLSKL